MRLFSPLGAPGRFCCHYPITPIGNTVCCFLLQCPSYATPRLESKVFFAGDQFRNGHVTQVGALKSRVLGKFILVFLGKLLLSFSGPDWMQNTKSEKLSLSLHHSRGEANDLRKSESKDYQEKWIQTLRIKSALKLPPLWTSSYVSQRISCCFSRWRWCFLVLADEDQEVSILLCVKYSFMQISPLHSLSAEEALRLIHPQCVCLVQNLRSVKTLSYEAVTQRSCISFIFVSLVLGTGSARGQLLYKCVVNK